MEASNRKRYGCCPASGLKFGERMRSGVATKNWQLSDHNKANRRALLFAAH